ncbi:hypothetical protein [Pseudenhygromyxa sp. WMMC2535]|uniref:hypothetical protein n=1 Tax=Pseudenhygromyxa sp. WMMC2535 TaxID=2712867 RepID=UPI001C3CDAFD|nr:hypothetical protein [Pseudenhygromyxa sp. WMMC2535]
MHFGDGTTADSAGKPTTGRSADPAGVAGCVRARAAEHACNRSRRSEERELASGGDRREASARTTGRGRRGRIALRSGAALLGLGLAYAVLWRAPKRQPSALAPRSSAAIATRGTTSPSSTTAGLDPASPPRFARR